MTESETTALLTLLKAAYPRQSIDATTVMVYSQMLADLDAQEAARAVERLVKRSRYFPTIAEIRAEVERPAALERQLEHPSGADAWGEVLEQVARAGRYRRPAFSDPLITRAVAGVGWEAICNSETPGVERAHFLRLYAELLERAGLEEQLDQLDKPAAPRLGPTSIARLLPGGRR